MIYFLLIGIILLYLAVGAYIGSIFDELIKEDNIKNQKNEIYVVLFLPGVVLYAIACSMKDVGFFLAEKIKK